MRIKFVCGCGLENYTWADWISHYKYGRGAWNALKLFLKTRIEFVR